MTDDELTAAAVEVFAHFDRREAESERLMLLKAWAWSIFCWDGLLPFVVISVPALVSFLFPNLEAAYVVVNVVVPIAAFFIRYRIGTRYFHERSQYMWQYLLFLLSIICLILVDALVILSHEMREQLTESDLKSLGSMFLIYLVAMAIALFPFVDLRKACTRVRAASTEFSDIQ